MLFEKLVNSKINTVADWIIRIVVLNVLIVVCALPIITAYPALSAGYNRFNDYISGKEGGLVSGYVAHLKTHFFRKMWFGIIVIMMFILGYFNVRYYVNILDANAQVLYLVGYYISLILLVALSVVSLYTFTVIKVRPLMKLSSIFKVAFYLSGKFFLRTIMLILIVFLPVLLLLYPLTAVVFVFAGVSGPMLLNVLLTKDAVHHLERLGETHASRD